MLGGAHPGESVELGDSDASPTLAVQGTKDRYVNYEQSVWIVERLLAAGGAGGVGDDRGCGSWVQGSGCGSARKEDGGVL